MWQSSLYCFVILGKQCVLLTLDRSLLPLIWKTGDNTRFWEWQPSHSWMRPPRYTLCVPIFIIDTKLLHCTLATIYVFTIYTITCERNSSIFHGIGGTIRKPSPFRCFDCPGTGGLPSGLPNARLVHLRAGGNSEQIRSNKLQWQSMSWLQSAWRLHLGLPVASAP